MHKGDTVYLPCSSGNSPTSSDNLDQSVGSMNPHQPGAQDKISRPSQVVRDRRHEITFSVFDSLLSQQTQRQSRSDQKKKRKEVGEFYSVHASLTSVPGRTSAPTLVMRSPLTAPHQDAKHLLTTERANYMDTHVLAKLSRCSGTNKSKPPTQILSSKTSFFFKG